MVRAFSIIVPVFNKEKEIIRTLESIEDSLTFFYQQYSAEPNQVSDRPPESEIIIVNEGSTDRTLERVTEFCQDKPHYTIINHFKSLGAGSARNTGVKVSRGEIIFFCDSDDLFFKEHIYLCFKLISHNPGHSSAPTVDSFRLVSDRGSFNIPLPQQAVGVVRTGAYMRDTLHPYWKAAIENSIPLNLCLRRICHEFIEGFPEALVYKQLGDCEDIAYGLALSQFFRSIKVDLETVEYIRYPGNNFDRQLKKFQTPPEQYQDDVPPERKELHLVRQKLEQEKLAYLLEKLKKFDKTPEFLSILNWKQLTNEYLLHHDYAQVVRLCEAGILGDPTVLEVVRNPLAVAYNNLGSAFHQQGRPAQAADSFKKAIEVQPSFSKTDLARIHFNVGTALKEQGEFGHAITYLEKALELDAQLPEAIAALPGTKYKALVAEKGYQFTQDWFSHNISTWQQQLSRFVGMPDLNVLEIGSWEGRSTCWLLDHVLTHASAGITCVDTFEGGVEHQATHGGGQMQTIEARFDGNMARTGHPEKVKKLVGKSQEVLRSLTPNTYHLAYIDGSHIASDVIEDALLVWKLMRVGGVIIFDDYGFSFSPEIQEVPPKAAIDAFMAIFTHKMRLLHQGYQVILEKIAD